MTKISKKPNIVFIMADDMGYGDIGCYGSIKIRTPHMDQLAKEGMRFTDVHSSSAVCTPSRYSVLTGRYCWRTPLKEWVLWGFEPPLIDPQRQTVAALLKEQGYATAAIGKWHLGLGWTTLDGNPPLEDGTNVDYTVTIDGGPRQLGFDTNFNITGSLDMAPYCFIEDDHVFKEPCIEKHPYHPQQRSGLMSPGWQDDQVDLIFTEKAVEFINQQANNDPVQPFFLYLTPSAPHRPCVPPDFIHGRSQAGPRGDMVALVDWMVGQIDAALKRHKLVENTLIIVTSDNGARATDFYGNDYGHKSCGNLRGQKADIWDGGHREPFIARWPDMIKPGTTSDALVCLGDLMATCADILDVQLQENAAEDSFSFLPALRGELGENISREMIVHHSGDGMFSIRDKEWKLILGCGSGGFTEPRRIDLEPGQPQGQLYNMQEDVQETCNLWAEEPQIVERLTAILEDTIAKRNNHYPDP